MNSVGISVLAPKPGNIVREVDGFKIMDIDDDKTPDEIEKGFLESLFNSHFAYIVDPGGYIGFNTATELGLAHSARIPVIAMEPLDPTLDDSPTWPQWCESVGVRKIDDMVDFLKDPVTRISRTIQYEKHRQKRLPMIQELIENVLSHARMVNLDFDSLGPGAWEINNEGRPEQLDIISRLDKLYAETGKPVPIYIGGQGLTVTYSPDRGFEKDIQLETPKHSDPPGIYTFGYIEVD
jgi:hypothetical protein